MKQKILLPALLAAMLVIAGCGGGNSAPPGGPGSPEGLSDLQDAITKVLALDGEDTDTAIKDAIAELNRAKDAYDGTDPNNLAEAERRVGDLEEIVTARGTAKDSELLNELQTAVSALETLSAGDDKEGSALNEATVADGKTNAVNALGSSAMVKKYGDDVLQAKKDLQDALDKAKAEQAKVTGDLASGSAGKELRENAKSAIEAAEGLLADGKTPGVRRGALEELVVKYEGEGNTPDEKADAAAKEVFAILAPNVGSETGEVAVGSFNLNPSGTAVNLADAIKPSGPDALPTAFATGNSAPDGVRLFSDIFGSDKNDAGNTRFSLNGMNTSRVTGITLPIAKTLAGAELSGTAMYLGIGGAVHCYGAECAVPANDTFGAGWYFVPASAETNKRYVWNSDTGVYDQARYVEWGLWITDANDNEVIDRAELHSFVGQGQGSAALITANMSSAAHTSDTSGVTKATYTGAAAGLSVRRTGAGTEASPHVHASGHFVADVTLNAVFRATRPELSGMIDGFESADPEKQGTAHVDTNWKIALTKSLPVGSLVSVIADLGTLGNGTEVDGTWTANAYRKTAVPTDAADAANDHHPDAFFGRFNARFLGDDATTSTGGAAGNYHAEKE